MKLSSCFESFYMQLLKIYVKLHKEVLLYSAKIFFFFLLQHPVAYGSSWARDQIQATAATYTTAVAVQDS